MKENNDSFSFDESQYEKKKVYFEIGKEYEELLLKKEDVSKNADPYKIRDKHDIRTDLSIDDNADDVIVTKKHKEEAGLTSLRERVEVTMPQRPVRVVKLSSELKKKKNDAFIIEEARLNAIKVEQDKLEGFDRESQKDMETVLRAVLRMGINVSMVKNDNAILRNAGELEGLVARLATLDGMTHLDEYLTQKDAEDHDRYIEITERLAFCRQIAAYYTLKRDILTDPLYVSRKKDDITLELRDDLSEEEKKLIEKMMQANVVERSFNSNIKPLKFESAISREIYVGNEAIMSDGFLKSIIKQGYADAKDAYKNRADGNHVMDYPPEIEEALKAKEKLDVMPRTTADEIKKYYSQKKKFYKLQRSGYKNYIANIQKNQGVLLSNEVKEYLSLLCELSLLTEVEKGGFYEPNRIERICVCLDKIQASPCFADHEKNVPAFLEQTLSVGSREKLLNLIEEINALDSKLVYEDVPEQDGEKTLVRERNENNLMIDSVSFRFKKETDGSGYMIDSEIAGSRFMEYMGMGKNTRLCQPVFCKDKDGKRHWGYKQNEKYSQKHLWMNRLVEKSGQPGELYDLVYTPEAIRQLANISLIYAIAGRKAPNPAEDMNLVISEYSVNKEVVKDNGIVNTVVRSVKTVTGVYLNGTDGFFWNIDAKNLRESEGARPAFDEINIPFLDEEFVEKILALDAKDLIGISGGLLDRDDERRYFERLEYIKGKLRERKEQDALRPEGEKTILKKEDWEKPENRNRLETLLQNQREQVFPQLLGDHVLIEGASHKGIPVKDKKNANYIESGKKNYEKLYFSLKKAIAGAKSIEDKLEVLVRLNSIGSYYAKEVDYDMYGDIFARLLNETIDKNAIRSAFYKKNMLAVQIADLVSEKLRDPDFKVPDEYIGYNVANKSAKDIEDLKMKSKNEYAMYLVFKEHKDLYMEATEWHRFTGNAFSNAGSYENGAMIVGLDNVDYYNKGLQKEVTAQQCSQFGDDFAARLKAGAGLLSGSTSFQTFPAEISEKVNETYFGEGKESLGSFLRRYDALILDETYEKAKEQLVTYRQLNELAEKGDAQVVFDKILEMRNSGDPEAIEVTDSFISDIKQYLIRYEERQAWGEEDFNRKKSAGQAIGEVYVRDAYNAREQFADDFLKLWRPEEEKDAQRIPGLRDRGLRMPAAPEHQLLGAIRNSRQVTARENGYRQQRTEGEEQQKQALSQNPNVAIKFDGEAYRTGKIESLEQELNIHMAKDTTTMTNQQKEDTNNNIARCRRQIEEHRTQIERIRKRKEMDAPLKIVVRDELFNTEGEAEFDKVIKDGELYPFEDLMTGLTQGPSTCYYTSILLSLVKAGREDFIKNTLIKDYSSTQAVVRLHDEDGLPLDIVVDKSRRSFDTRPLWLIVLDKAMAVVLNKNGFDPAKRENVGNGARYATNVDWEKWSKDDSYCKQGGLFYRDISEGSEEMGFKLIFGTEPLKFTLRPSQVENDQELYTGNEISVYKNSRLKEGDIAIGRIKALLDAKKVVLASTCGNMTEFMTDDQLKAADPGVAPYLNNYFPALDATKFDPQANLVQTHAYMICGIDEERRVVEMIDPLTSAQKEVTFETFRHHFTDVRAGD